MVATIRDGTGRRRQSRIAIGSRQKHTVAKYAAAVIGCRSAW